MKKAARYYTAQHVGRSRHFRGLNSHRVDAVRLNNKEFHSVNPRRPFCNSEIINSMTDKEEARRGVQLGRVMGTCAYSVGHCAYYTYQIMKQTELDTKSLNIQLVHPP